MINKLNLSIAALGVILLVGCSSSDGKDTVTEIDDNAPSTENTTTETVVSDKESQVLNKLAPQSGTHSELFYGNSKHNALGTLSSVQVLNIDGTKGASRDSIDVRYPVVNTAFSDDGNGKYSDLHTQSISYVSDDKAYTVSMAKDSGAEVVNSSVGTLTSYSYEKVRNLGSKHYLVATGDAGTQVLVTPDMGATDAPLAFDHKSLEAVATNGYIVIHDDDDDKATTNELQKCDLDMENCSKIADVESVTKYSHGRPYAAYDMTLLGDIIQGSIYLSDNKIHKLNKA